MSTLPSMPRDNGNAAVQALCPYSTTVLSVSSSSARVALPTNSRVVRLACNQDIHVAFGDNTVTATTNSMLFPFGAEVFNIAPLGATHIAALTTGATPGVLTITIMV